MEPSLPGAADACRVVRSTPAAPVRDPARPCPATLASGEPVNLHLDGLSLDPHRGKRDQLEAAVGSPARVAAHEDVRTAFLVEILNPRRQVDRIADESIRVSLRAPDVAGEDRPRVDPDAVAERDLPGPRALGIPRRQASAPLER